MFRQFKRLETRKCPFAKLPESEKGRWKEGLTAADMETGVWLKPKLVAAIEYAEWTPANHLRHSRFVALREDKNPGGLCVSDCAKRSRAEARGVYWFAAESQTGNSGLNALRRNHG